MYMNLPNAFYRMSPMTLPSPGLRRETAKIAALGGLVVLSIQAVVSGMVEKVLVTLR